MEVCIMKIGRWLPSIETPVRDVTVSVYAYLRNAKLDVISVGQRDCRLGVCFARGFASRSRLSVLRSGSALRHTKKAQAQNASRGDQRCRKSRHNSPIYN